ncbi:MAG: polyprenyl synthetase family protein, partial [Proteobacteria bacterium]|nr:polyprenyl synthetase family protein [Pseudomonadota bacterium]
MSMNYRLAKTLAKLKTDMDKVSSELTQLLGADDPLLRQPFNSLISPVSKKIRPLISLLSSSLVGYTGDYRITLAVISEYIHMASLFHDDVVDKSDLRRGQKTCRLLYGNSTSVLVGDYVYARACELIATTGNLTILQLFAEAIKMMSLGELKQLKFSRDLSDHPRVTMAEYLDIIRKKTGCLLAATAEASYCMSVTQDPGAGTSSSLSGALYEFGMNLGVAYQMIDDTLDYSQDRDDPLKPLTIDFDEGKWTLPLLLTYAALSPGQDQEFFHNTFAHPETRLAHKGWFLEQIRVHKAFERSREQAKIITHKAIASLDLFPPCQAKDDLKNLTLSLL